ncbi:triose-phosphate isomerase [Candidatus Saccharibacteria bacterium]|nr:triose-phosphate isomerase [Candidatus Saccharibacteria bacterium]
MNTYIVGNWKMNFTVGESSIFLNKLLTSIPPHPGIKIIVAPSDIALQSLSLQTDRKHIRLCAQNIDYRDFGPITGETSASQVRGLADYALVGHPERRHAFHEHDKVIRAKVAACIRNKITPILCIGETAHERSIGETNEVLRDQLLGGLSDISLEDIHKVIIAYHPAWITSTTNFDHLATPDQITDAVKHIRKTLRSTYGKDTEQSVPVIYGGNVNTSNAGTYVKIPGVNGLLIGNASLIASQFIDIIEIVKKGQN